MFDDHQPFNHTLAACQGSIQRKDLPTMQAIVLVLSVIYVLLTLLADLLNAFLDPRLRVA
jgi:peptide/nickel transport system permease protein